MSAPVARGQDGAPPTAPTPTWNAPAPKQPAKADLYEPNFWNGFGLFTPPKPPPPPVDDFIVRPDGLTPEKAPETNTPDAQLAGARDLFRRKEYAKAQLLYHAVSQNAHAPVADVQEGLFYEAECLRLQSMYPRAADTYNDLLTKFANTPYRDQAVQHMFDIANYWLDDTRQEMKEWEDYKNGKSWFFWPRFFTWDKTKPLLDEQGRAVEKLEEVRQQRPDRPVGRPGPVLRRQRQDVRKRLEGRRRLFHADL